MSQITTLDVVLHLAAILGRITTRDEAGKHFTAIYEEHDLDALEAAGLIRIDRPVHSWTGIPYSQEHWGVEVTEAGIEFAEAHS